MLGIVHPRVSLDAAALVAVIAVVCFEARRSSVPARGGGRGGESGERG